METEQYCFRKYKFECFINKIELHCYCVVFFDVCQIPVKHLFCSYTNPYKLRLLTLLWLLLLAWAAYS